MNDWEKNAQSTFNGFLNTFNTFIEDSSKALEDFGKETQTFIDSAIERGETIYHQWLDEELIADFTKPKGQQPSPERRKRLFVLVKGDQALANRLLALARRTYPDHSEDWYWEKVIYDLERDQ